MSVKALVITYGANSDKNIFLATLFFYAPPKWFESFFITNEIKIHPNFNIIRYKGGFEPVTRYKAIEEVLYEKTYDCGK